MAMIGIKKGCLGLLTGGSSVPARLIYQKSCLKYGRPARFWQSGGLIRAAGRGKILGNCYKLRRKQFVSKYM